MFNADEAEVLSGISGQRAFQHVAQLQSNTERISGTEAERRGALEVKQLLEPLADTCLIESFPAVANIRGRGRLEVVAPIALSVPSEVNGLCGSGCGRGRLLYAGSGTRYDYDLLGASVRGSIVLISAARSRLGAWWQFLAREAAARGAQCLVYHPGGWEDDALCVHGVNFDFPVLTISNQSAAALRKLLAQHPEVTVEFESDYRSRSSTGHNVVGTIEGGSRPEETIYLTAHHDSYFHGANDNLSSCACVLETARLLSGHRPKRTFKFVLFGGEESGRSVAQNIVCGLHGSFCYSETHRSELTPGSGQVTICAINGEFLGNTPRARMTCSPELVPFVRGAAVDLGDYIEAAGGPDGTWTDSDHLCFHTLGIPTIYLHDRQADLGTGRLTRGARVYHSALDNTDIISVRALESNSRLMALLALRLDAADPPPYSMESVLGEVARGAEGLPDRSSLVREIRRKAADVAAIEDRRERMQRLLRLLSVTNKQLYTFMLRDFLHKFRVLSDTAVKLREAHHIADMEGDLARARAVLVATIRGSIADGFDSAVLEQMNEVKALPSVLSRLAPCQLELRSLLDLIDRNAPAGDVLAGIESKAREVVETAGRWQREFTEAIEEV